MTLTGDSQQDDPPAVSQLKIEDDEDPEQPIHMDDKVEASHVDILDTSMTQRQSSSRSSSLEEALPTPSAASSFGGEEEKDGGPSASAGSLSGPTQEEQETLHVPHNPDDDPPALPSKSGSLLAGGPQPSASDSPHESQQVQVPSQSRANESSRQGTQEPSSSSQHRPPPSPSPVTATTEEPLKQETTSDLSRQSSLDLLASVAQPLPILTEDPKKDMPLSEIPPEFLPLKRHMCSFQGCFKSFHRKSDLIRHERIHVNDRPHACTWPNCGKRFGQKHALKVHYR